MSPHRAGMLPVGLLLVFGTLGCGVKGWKGCSRKEKNG